MKENPIDTNLAKVGAAGYTASLRKRGVITEIQKAVAAAARARGVGMSWRERNRQRKEVIMARARGEEL